MLLAITNIYQFIPARCWGQYIRDRYDIRELRLHDVSGLNNKETYVKPEVRKHKCISRISSGT